MNLTEQTALLKVQKSLHDKLQSGASLDSQLWAFLVESESVLIQLMNNNPPSPQTQGNVEFGWALYYLNNDAPSWLTTPLRNAGMPTSKITASDWVTWWDIWNGEGVLLGDGTLLYTSSYGQMDPGWSISLIYYMLQEIDILSKPPLPNTPATLDLSALPSLKIAIFGDWGTGSYPDGNLPNSSSQLVMAQIAKQNPDVMIHLGDVYYAGLPSEEQNKLLDCWQQAPHGNFTLNSNHEMYDVADGLLNTALTNPIFADQNNTTFFSINYGDWVIIGLDSAYNATSFYMDGVINDSFQSGPNGFINTQAKNKKTILLTHHNPIDVQGLCTNDLWQDVVVNSLGGAKPDVWYWGHVHNGVVYNDKAASDSTLARCLGHAAIPFGDASWLHNQPTVDYYTHTPLNDGFKNNALRMKNGFAILEISNGQLTETWYDQDGVQCWTS
jgi:Calcineurin-like phosphoesterase